MQFRHRRLFAISFALVPLVFAALPLAADDAQPAKSARPADAAAKAGSSGEWQWPKVVISKETTYFTEPLRPDGGVDYVAAFNRCYSKGVTPENNAAVALWQAVGPGDDPGNIEPKDRKRFFELLGIPALPEKGDYLFGFWELPEYQRIKKGSEEEVARSAEIWGQFEAARRAPWSKEDYPVWAEVMERSETPLKTLAEGLQRPRIYVPLVPDKPMGGTLIGATGLRGTVPRHAMRFLAIRATLGLRDGDVSAKWQDVMALYRLQRLWSRLPLAIDWLIAAGEDTYPNQAAIIASQRDGITAAQARECQRQIRSLPPMRPLWEICDEGERCSSIETLMLIADSKDPTAYFEMVDSVFNRNDPKHGSRVKAFHRLVAGKNVDWTEVLRCYNTWQDRLVNAHKSPTSAKAIAMLDALETETKKTANRAAASVMAAKPEVVDRWEPKIKAQRLAELAALPAVSYLSAAFVRRDQRRQAEENLAIAAFALAGYRADHHEYPKTLANLVPAYIDALPQDPFTEGALRYKPEQHGGRLDGYLLYSVGQNGKDEEGRGPESFNYLSGDGRNDDISIRMPPKKIAANEK
jgi:hypothetical protein